jgi:hypothetical protein
MSRNIIFVFLRCGLSSVENGGEITIDQGYSLVGAGRKKPGE